MQGLIIGISNQVEDEINNFGTGKDCTARLCSSGSGQFFHRNRHLAAQLPRKQKFHLIVHHERYPFIACEQDLRRIYIITGTFAGIKFEPSLPNDGLTNRRAFLTWAARGQVKPPWQKPHGLAPIHQSRSFIFEQLKKAEGRKTVVMTHHGISPLSIHERYRGDNLNWAFMSDLSQEILDHGPLLWVHGHTHDSFDYVLGKTRVVVNPYGYQEVEMNPQYDSRLLIEL